MPRRAVKMSSNVVKGGKICLGQFFVLMNFCVDVRNSIFDVHIKGILGIFIFHLSGSKIKEHLKIFCPNKAILGNY